MNAVANIFDLNGDGYIDYYEFVSALHPSRDPYRRTLDADQINEEVCVIRANTIRAHPTSKPSIVPGPPPPSRGPHQREKD